MNKYYKNFILCGDLDQYCLLCKETFHLIPDIEKHIRWEKHRKLLKEQSLLPKLKKDFIYKIDNGYYCEKCNLVAPKLAAITEHIKTEKHDLLKNNPDAEIKKPAGLYDCGYVVINKVIISRIDWHSIVHNKCLICDINFDNMEQVNAHMATSGHMIKLIQSETKHANNQYYRKINDETYHCFACKTIFVASNYANHWMNCENDKSKLEELQRMEANKYIGSMTEDINRMEQLEKNLVNTFQEFYDIDETNNIAKCKTCNEGVSIDFVSMLTHMRNDHRRRPATSSSSDSSDSTVVYREIVDNGEKRAKLKAYGATRYIKMNYNGSRGYCKLCDRYLSANKHLFRDHVKGAIHRGNLELLGLKKPKIREDISYGKQNIKSYLYNLQCLPNVLAFWIKGELPVDINSFFLIYVIPKDPHYKKTKCFVCDEVFSQGKEREHCLTVKHKDNFFAAEVLSKSDEFVRELRPNLFHCGFCNICLPFSDTLEKHLVSYKHIKVKTEKEGEENSATEILRTAMAPQVCKKKKKIEPKIQNFWLNFNPATLEITTGDEDLYVELIRHVFG